MRKIKKVRFDALAGYTRNSAIVGIGKEVEWYEKENVLGVLFLDYIDKKYNVIILGQDDLLKFRCIGVFPNFFLKCSAKREMKKKLNYLAKQNQNVCSQGVEGKGLDFFKPLFPEVNLNPYFKLLAFNESYLPAKELISFLMRYYETNDVGFVNQFQTDGFHSRIWELYLYAMLSEIGFSFEINNVVDFLCRNTTGTIAVEATAINPSHHHIGSEDGQIQSLEYSQNVDAISIRIRNLLIRKLNKKYWEKIGDIPLIIAIQDFHYPRSSQLLVRPLMNYLYGERLIKDNNHYKMINIGTHNYKNKKMKSNFFQLPKSENISAVICNTQGTLPKFNRMGIVADFRHNKNLEIRRSITFMKNGDGELKITPLLNVLDKDYHETWVEGLNVFHNPRARVPLNPDFFPEAYHCFGDNYSYPQYYVFNSTNIRFQERNDKEG